MTDVVREPARAKMNLRLRVLGRGRDGYHALETLFLRLDLGDGVELRPGSGGIELEVEAAPPGPATPGPGGGDPGGGGEQASLFPAERDAAARGDAAAPGGDPEAASGPDRDATDDDGPSGAPGPAGRGAAGRAAPVDLDDVPSGPENLCWRAARRFHEELGEDPDVSVRLVKRVPAAGGLGGGSADAAAVLRGLSRLHGSPLPPEALMRIAGELGSDVPFALLDRPMALGWERGRRLMPLEPPSARPVLLLVPEVRVPTPEAYGWLDEHRSGGGEAGPSAPHPAGALPPAGDLSRWDVLLSVRGNDFEAPVFARIPELAWWKEELLGEGAEAALLCGSGSTLCGIFDDERRRDAAADRLRESGEVQVVRTRGPV